MSRALVAFGALALWAPGAGAQFIDIPDWDHAVAFELVASQTPVRPGDELELAVVAEIVDGYHLYGPKEKKPNRTEVRLQSEHLEGGEPVFPPVIRRDLSGLGEFDLYEGTVAIRIPAAVRESAGEEAALAAEVRVNYQVCTDVACSPPDEKVLSLQLPVAEKGASVRKSNPGVFEKRR